MVTVNDTLDPGGGRLTATALGIVPLARGRWLPFAADVAWEVDGVSETYWTAEMKRWDIVAR